LALIEHAVAEGFIVAENRSSSSSRPRPVSSSTGCAPTRRHADSAGGSARRRRERQELLPKQRHTSRSRCSRAKVLRFVGQAKKSSARGCLTRRVWYGWDHGVLE